ncbi:MAG: hypothetical protein ACT4OS_03285 [Acidimicrobiales bacterium]
MADPGARAEPPAILAVASAVVVLDAVEHEGQGFTIVRRGRAVARLQPMPQRHGAAIKSLLRQHLPDQQWAQDLSELRASVKLEQRF